MTTYPAFMFDYIIGDKPSDDVAFVSYVQFTDLPEDKDGYIVYIDRNDKYKIIHKSKIGVTIFDPMPEDQQIQLLLKYCNERYIQRYRFAGKFYEISKINLRY